MPRDVNGTYTLPTNDSSPAAPRNVIRSSDFNELTGDYATALTDSLSRSGDGSMLADLDMDGFDVLNAGNLVESGAALVAAIEAIIPLLPTSLPGSAGKLWNNAGLLSIS